MEKFTLKDVVSLSSSHEIPRIGFGIYASPTDVCVASCLTALKLGYRHIDTAQLYGNEKEVGQAIKECGLPRKDIFITTKIYTAEGSAEATYAKCVESVSKLDGGDKGYVDLFLVHTPNGGAESRKEMWLAMERLYAEGKAKSIGVSNYGIKQIEEMKAYAKVWPPHANQIELHPWLQQPEIVSYCQNNCIVVEAYCPLVRNTKADDATVLAIAKELGVAPSQVLLRFSLQKGWIPLPKSDNPDRIRLNADIFDFSLSKEQMDILNKLDQGDAGAIVQAVSN